MHLTSVQCISRTQRKHTYQFKVTTDLLSMELKIHARNRPNVGPGLVLEIKDNTSLQLALCRVAALKCLPIHHP